MPGVHAATFTYPGEQPGGAPRRGRSRPAAPRPVVHSGGQTRRGWTRELAGQGGQARSELAAGRQRTPSRWTSAGTDPTPGVHAVTFHCLGEQPGGAPRRGRSRPAAPRPVVHSGGTPETGLPPEDCRSGRTSSFRACRRPSADSQSVDARRGGPRHRESTLSRSTASENSREEHLVEVALDRPHLSPSSIKGANPEGVWTRELAGQGGQARSELVAGRQRTPSRRTPAGADPMPGVHAVTFHCLGE
jgi:hypothetical protein